MIDPVTTKAFSKETVLDFNCKHSTAHKKHYELKKLFNFLKDEGESKEQLKRSNKRI